MRRIFDVTITGISPLMMHRFPMEPIEAIEKKSKEDQCEIAAYRMNGPDSELFVPGIALQRAFISGATYGKGKGRSSLQKVAAACIQINPIQVGLGTNKYEIDSRPVVVPATKGRIIRHRPKINEWTLSFQLEDDDNLLTENQTRQIVDDTGLRVGLLEFRAEKKGPFGRFKVTDWKKVKIL